MKLKKPSEFTTFISIAMLLLMGAMFCFYKAYTITHELKEDTKEESHRKCIKIDIRPDYTIELITQDSVLIQSGKIIYKCHFNDIQKAIEKDNL